MLGRGFGDIVGQQWKTYFFFCSPLLQREMTQCEEEDRSGQDTETERQTDLILHQI